MFRAILFVVTILLCSCIRNESKEREVDDSFDTSKDYFEHKTELNYSKGFTVSYHGYYKVVKVFDERTQELLDTYYLVQRGAPLPEEAKGETVIDIPVKSIACQSSTYLPAILAIGEEESVTGFSQPKYILNEVFQQRLKEGHIREISGGSELSLELLLDLDADMVMIYPFESQGYSKIREAGIKLIYNAEYAEKHPLGKAEWVKYLALFYNKEAEAEQVFSNIEKRYNDVASLVSDTEERPTVFMAKPFKGTWFMAPGNSVPAKFLEDAGADYLWKNTTKESNLSLSFEEVFDKAYEADFWVIVTEANSSYSLADLKAEDVRYAEFKAFKNKNVIFCNSFESDYFGDGTMEPHEILADLVKAFYPNIHPKHIADYFKSLE